MLELEASAQLVQSTKGGKDGFALYHLAMCMKLAFVRNERFFG